MLALKLLECRPVNKMNRAVSILLFFSISLIGLLIDISIFQGLLKLIKSPFLASSISSFAAISFVFIAYRFIKLGSYYSNKQFVVWVFYQIITISVYSILIANLLVSGFAPYVAKLSLVPLSFLLNFIVLNKILRIN